jgi:hypothetical protein
MASHWLRRRFNTALTLPLAALALVTLTGCDLMMADLSARATEEWKRSYDLASGGRVEVLNINGPIEIEPAGGKTLEVLAEKTARGVSEEAAKAALSRIEIVEQTSAKEVRIETRVPKVGAFSRGASVRYVVRVPAGTEVRVRTVNGAVKLSDVSGTLKADTTNGSISGRGLDGSLEAGTTNGGIDIEMDKVAEGGVRLETTNGGIDLRIPKDTAATLSARLTNGRIEASSLGIQVQGEVSRRRLEGTLNGGGPRIALETTNGGITIAAKVGT